MTKRIKFILLLILTGFFTLIVTVEFSFSNGKQNPLVNVDQKKWSHRGYATSKQEENTIEAIRKAILNEYFGVEIDVWFKNDQFYIHHDINSSSKTLTLSEVFETFPDTYFWLDLKNLNLSNINSIANQLKKFEKNKTSYFIESKNGLALGLLHKKEFQTSLWIMKGGSINQFIDKFWISIFKYNCVSMPLSTYRNSNNRDTYKHLNVLLWSAKSNKVYSEFPEVKIVLDDDEQYIN